MLRATAVEILLSSADLEQALEEHAVEQVESARVSLEDGALVLDLKVVSEKLPMAVPVQLRLKVRGTRDTEVELGVSWSNLPLLPGFLKELALQKAFEALPGRYQDGIFTVDAAELLQHVPVSFRITSVRIEREGIRVSLCDVVAFPQELAGLIAEQQPGALVPVPSQEEAQLPEHQSFYQRLRGKVGKFTAEKAPRWAQPLVPWVLAVPDFFVLMVRLARDERVPAGVKVVVGVVIAYFLSPVDLIPDPIPLIGEIDDLALALFALDQIAHRVPHEVIEELWPGEGKVLDLVRSGTDLVNRALPGKMLVAIKRLLQKK